MLSVKKALSGGALGTLLAFSAPQAWAQAAQPAYDFSYLSASFAQPTGTISPTETVNVVLTLSLAADAPQAFEFDFSDFGNPVVSPGILPLAADNGIPFQNFYYASLGLQIPGGSTFLSNSPYRAQFAEAPRVLHLAPGESFSYTAFILTPPAQGAPDGTYTFNYSRVYLWFVGVGTNNQSVSAAVTLDTRDSAAGPGFIRTVGVVPEPGSVVLVAAGLGVFALVRRRAL